MKLKEEGFKKKKDLKRTQIPLKGIRHPQEVIRGRRPLKKKRIRIFIKPPTWKVSPGLYV